MADLIGQTLGQYRITSVLGRGGMATVYRAEQPSMARDVAVKVIDPRLAESEDFMGRFQREARTVASLSHPHILKVFDYGQQGDLVYLVMDLIKGGSLADLIHKGPLSLEQTARILDQIAGALDYAHELSIVHRDLKPQNVLLDSKGNAYLTDFGIAKILSETTSFTKSGTVMGTPAYMSPEQWQGEPVDSRVDIYALGVMVFEMLAGETPFNADTPYRIMVMHVNEPPPSVRTWRPDVHGALEAVLNKALAKNRDQRYGSAGELAAAFRAALSAPKAVISIPQTDPIALPTSSIPPTSKPPITSSTFIAVPPATTTSNRNRVAFVAWISAAFVAVVAIGLFVTNQARRGTEGVPFTQTRESTVLVAAQSSATPDRTADPSPRPTDTTVPTNDTASATHTAVPPTAPPTIPTLAPSRVYSPTTQPDLATLAADTYTKTPTPTPSPTGSSTQDAKGVTQVWVPTGSFLMGSDPATDKDSDNNEQPQSIVIIAKGFWLDKTEVTNAAYQQFIVAGGYSNLSLWTDAGKDWLKTHSEPNNFPGFTSHSQPRVGITWYESYAYCKWRGGRLPTEAEWEYAARGTDGRIYPWGNEFKANNVVYVGNSDGKTAPVGDGIRTAGASWVGALDMVGNVWEWVNTIYDGFAYPYKNDGREETTGNSSVTRVLRGGSWGYGSTAVRAASRGGVAPDGGDDTVGVRCARSS